MRILWFTNTPSLYRKSKDGYNGGGWISSLEELIGKDDRIEQLGVCFFDIENNKVTRDKTVYYPINLSNKISNKLKFHFNHKSFQKAELKRFAEVIEDFKPDIIHIFGTENAFGLISKYSDIPVIIHLQGILIPYLNASDLPGVGKFEYLKHYNLKEFRSKYRSNLFFKRGSIREKEIFLHCKNYMGRTGWDKNIIKIFSPGSNYFHCDEILRSPFYKAQIWEFKKRDKMILTTTISLTEYKGFDLILKTAKLLKDEFHLNFEWNVIGVSKYSFWEKQTKIKATDVNVSLRGIVDANNLIKYLSDSDIFIHPSYIDNSPNSVCEAQLLGLPVISTNVGGISSLIESEKEGILVPTNDPYTLACKIIELRNNTSKAISIGKTARERALKRHDVENITERNIEIYNTILKP